MEEEVLVVLDKQVNLRKLVDTVDWELNYHLHSKIQHQLSDLRDQVVEVIGLLVVEEDLVMDQHLQQFWLQVLEEVLEDHMQVQVMGIMDLEVDLMVPAV